MLDLAKTPAERAFVEEFFFPRAQSAQKILLFNQSGPSFFSHKPGGHTPRI